MKIVDTCGVHNLHGMPGLLGGLTAAIIVPGVAKAQLIGIACTVVLAFVSGTLCGHVVAFAGKKAAAYQDQDEFLGEASPDGDEDQPLVAAEPSLGA
ncbi:MAG TPA: hypothetical protein VF518_14490 [Polyangia bacterium]